MGKFTKSPAARKHSKPYAGFPLTPHPSGRWCKKIRGKLRYFGKLDDPDAALERFSREWPFLKDGRTPPPIDTADGCTVRQLANAFLTSKKALLDSGELSPRSFQDYMNTCGLAIDNFGRDRRIDDLRPDDFDSLRAAIAKGRSLVTVRDTINRVRVLMKYASDQRLIDRPVHYGQSFDRPTALALRRARNQRGPRLFAVAEISRILKAAGPQMQAMALLGLNAGFGNTDCATLPLSAVDLKRGWITFPRPKTGIQRRVPLWPETVKAVQKVIDQRPNAKLPEDAACVFLTQAGARWVRVQPKRVTDKGGDEQSAQRIVAIDALSQKFAKLLKSLAINGGRGFYTLRHVFETIGGESKDQVAVDFLMGHVDPTMGAVYREGISDDRLRSVVEVVRRHVFPSKRRR